MNDLIKQQDDALQSLVDKAVAYSNTIKPITPEMAAAAPTWRAAYSDRTCALMAAFCSLAYDKFEDRSGIVETLLKAKLERAGFTLVAAYDVNATTQGFLAVGKDFAVLAFRGTTDAADWRVNFNAGLLPLSPDRPEVKVHAGFLGAFNSVQAQIRQDLLTKIPQNRGFYITGHSLGGGIAQIASAALECPILAACYTFGSPRVGGADFDYEVKCPNYRVVNQWDLVPAVPPPGWRGYHHAGDIRQLVLRGRPPYRGARAPLRFLLRVPIALFVYLFRRKFFLIDDHMIWNYLDMLEAAAVNRNPPTAPGGPPPSVKPTVN